MPCDSSYLEPNAREKNLSKVVALQAELETGELPKYYGRGMLPGGGYFDGDLDKEVEKLCTSLLKMEPAVILLCSLELQMWWRDHQVADQTRKIREAKEEMRASDKQRTNLRKRGK